MVSSATPAGSSSPRRLRVRLLEPYFTGSHAEWARGYRSHSSHEVTLETMPGRFWKWRMHGAAITLAGRPGLTAPPPDVVLATDMLDVATWRGLALPALRAIPIVTYFHENQFAYPDPRPQPTWTGSRRRRAGADFHYGFVNLTTALASDAVWFNSRFNLDSFLEGARRLLRSMPDCREAQAVPRVQSRAKVMPLGMRLKDIPYGPSAPRAGVPRILWNHRWEHDKGPAAFVDLVERLAAEGTAFDVVVLGEAPTRTEPMRERLVQSLGSRLAKIGHVTTRDEYFAWLRSADVVVSAAEQEFFGAAVVEAVAAGCRPVLPDRLAYPELLPEDLHGEILYADPDACASLTRRALATSEAWMPRLVEHVMRFDWQSQAPRYDDSLLEVVGRARRTWTGEQVL